MAKVKQEFHLVGCGGLARDIASVLLSAGSAVAGYWDDNIKAGTQVGRYQVLGSVQELLQSNSAKDVIIAVGNPKTRKRLYEALQENKSLRFPLFVHPAAHIADAENVQLSPGVFVFPGAILTTDILIGENVLIHAGVSLHHDTKVGNHSVLMPGSRITGGATLGEGTFLGPNIGLSEANSYPDFSILK